MTSSASRPAMTSISPFFIVRDIERSLSFYRDHLGFDVTFLAPERDAFFAMIRRDGAQLILKVTEEHIEPLPNRKRHPWARWDAYVHVPDPDALAVEFASRGVDLDAPLADTDDALRGLQVCDPDGYVLFFGRPR